MVSFSHSLCVKVQGNEEKKLLLSFNSVFSWYFEGILLKFVYLSALFRNYGNFLWLKFLPNLCSFWRKFSFTWNLGSVKFGTFRRSDKKWTPLHMVSYYYPHWSRDSVSPACGLFKFIFWVADALSPNPFYYSVSILLPVFMFLLAA